MWDEYCFGWVWNLVSDTVEEYSMECKRIVYRGRCWAEEGGGNGKLDKTVHYGALY